MDKDKKLKEDIETIKRMEERFIERYSCDDPIERKNIVESAIVFLFEQQIQILKKGDENG